MGVYDPTMHSRPTTGTRAPGRRTLVGALALGALALLCPGSADAHFILREPASWMSQDFLGSPQKQGPCGSEAGGTPTSSITAMQAGQTITITLTETIFHPGHYRIALAVHDRSELPAEPVVTPNSTPCGTVEIQSPPVFPVLADGVLAHTAPFSGPQTIHVTLPPDVTCDHCTLQVLEFMSNHPLNNPGGCFYHHCADLSISRGTMVTVDGGGAATDAGVAAVDAGVAATDVGVTAVDTGVAATDVGVTAVDVGGTATASGHACSAAPSRARAPFGLGALFALAALGRRRRRRG